MKKYTLSELLNCTYDKYNEVGNELIGLNSSIIEKPNYRNLKLYAACDWNNTSSNVINGYWDIDKPRIICLFELLKGIDNNNYHLDIQSDGKTTDYPEFEISDIEKWNYYYNLLKSNEFVHNIMPFSFYNNHFEDDYDERNMDGSANLILAKRYLQSDKSPSEIVDFRCMEPYQLKYANIDKSKLTIDELNEFLHTFTFDDREINKYLSEMLDSNNGNDFDLENRIDDCIVDNKSKEMSLKLIK